MPKSQQELDTQYVKSVDELYDVTSRFFTDAALFKKKLPPLKSALSAQEYTDLQIYQLPYQKFQNFLVSSSKNLSHAQRIREIRDQFNSELFKTGMKASLETFSNNTDFLGFTNSVAGKINTSLIVKDISKGWQTFNRFALLIPVMRDNFLKLQHVPKEIFYDRKDNVDFITMDEAQKKDFTDDLNEKYSADEVVNILKIVEKHPKQAGLMSAAEKTAFEHDLKAAYPKADIDSILILDDMVAMHRKLQKSANASAVIVSISKQSESERKKLLVEKVNNFQIETLFGMQHQLTEYLKQRDDKDKVVATDQLLTNFLSKFSDLYIDERARGLVGTKRSDFLDKAMDIFFNTMNIEKPDKKPEEAIFEFAGKSKVQQVLVNHLYDRAMYEGVKGVNGNKDNSVFVNAIKAVVRMGNDAIATWNNLSKNKTQNDNNHLLLPLNTIDSKGKVKRISEDDIKTMYKEYFSNLSKHDMTRFQPAILVDSIVNAPFKPINRDPLNKTPPSADDWTDDQTKRFNTMTSDIIRASNSQNHAMIHQTFMLAYFDTYILERTKEGFHSTPGKLQKLLESIATDVKDHPDTALFGTVPPNSTEAMNLMLRAVALAVLAIKNDDEPQFVNIIKAVKRMKIVPQWNAHIEGMYDSLKLTDDAELSEKSIHKIWMPAKLAMAADSPRAESPLDKFGLMSNSNRSNSRKSFTETKEPEMPGPKKP